jgi:hypothetical protein
MVLCGLCALQDAPAGAQTIGPATAPLETIADPADRTGTNPANLRDIVELSNRFSSQGDGLFVDDVTWRYGQSFLDRRMRARVDVPLVFANVTGRTEAGLGDVEFGWEWVAGSTGRTAWLVGTDLSIDSATNEALATGHPVLSPSASLVFVPTREIVVSVQYRHRMSLGSADDWPDVADGTLEGAVVRRFTHGMWIRAVPALVVDHERDNTHGRLDGEWGRPLAGGFSTWVRAGGALGSQASRPSDWRLQVGFRMVL